MADDGNQDPSGHINSPLFNKLPAELRSTIYREVFIASKREVVRNADRTCVPRNEEFALVRACRATYTEARHIYWCHTAVKCALMSFRSNLNAIPDYARLRIRVLEGVTPVDNFTPTGQMNLVQFLRHFPRIQYCQLQRHTVQIYCHHDEIPPEGLLRKSGSDAFRDIARILNPIRPPVFVQRIYVWPTKDRDRVDWAYANHTHARLFITLKGSISDEEGFRKVTGPVEVVGEPGNSNDAHDANDMTEASDVHEADDRNDGHEADDEYDEHETGI